MLVTLYFVFLLVNLIFFINKKNSKLFVILTTAYILFVFCGSRNTVDLNGYLLNYNGEAKSSFQFLFYVPMNLSHKAGIGFYTFRFIYSAIALTLLSVFTIKCSKNYHSIYFIYLLYLFFLDDIQIRNFLASSFFLIAALFLLQSKKNWRIMFAIFTLIAGFIHESFLLYLVFLLVPTRKKQELPVKVIICLVFALSAVFFTNRDTLSFVSQMLGSIDSGRTNLYLLEKTNNGPLLFFAIQVLSFSLSYFIYKKYGSQTNDKVEFLSLKRIVWINLLCVFSFPFIIFSITFYRLLRNIILINAISISIACKYSKNKLFLPTVASLYCFVWFFSDILYNSDFVRIIVPIFENNIFK